MMNVREEILKIELRYTVNTLKILVDFLEEEEYSNTAMVIEETIKSAEEVLKG